MRRKCGRIRRNGVVVALAAVLMIVMLAMVAFAVDLGYLALTRTQLQAAADASALAAAARMSEGDAAATAQAIAAQNRVDGRAVSLPASDVETGSWDVATRTFTPSSMGVQNAVRVTTRTSDVTGGSTPLFFGRIFGLAARSQSASAVATANPRDIVFVVDLSGSMNDDTEPSSGSSSSTLMQQVYNDFNFGAYPGTLQAFGAPLGVTSTYANLQKANGPLNSKLPSSSPYYIKSSDSAATRTQKACSYVMNVQMASMMPNAVPTPASGNATSRGYWASYFTYCDSNNLKLGYQSYLQFMGSNGRDGQPYSSYYTPFSLNSNLCACPTHAESVGGMEFSFPPREMPTHAMRRALIAAIQVVQTRNQSIGDVSQRDWVSIVTFDKLGSGSPKVEQSLTSDYNSAMTACTRLQAVSSNGYSTCSEAGMALAYNHIKPASEGGVGREHTNKIVVFMTDGQPNLMQSSSSTVNSYISSHSSVWTDPTSGATSNNWITSGTFATQMNAALMQTSIMQKKNWYVYSAGVGLDCDANFMNHIARMGATANNQGEGPTGGGDPATYEANMAQIFKNIITNPKLRIVQ